MLDSDFPDEAAESEAAEQAEGFLASAEADEAAAEAFAASAAQVLECEAASVLSFETFSFIA